MNTHHYTFIHLIKGYISFLAHPELYYDSKSKKFEYSPTLFNIPTQHHIPSNSSSLILRRISFLLLAPLGKHANEPFCYIKK